MSGPRTGPHGLARPEYTLVIECFFDDSGKEGDHTSPYPCLAGYIAHESYWWDFVRDWKHLLLRHGIEAVHMKEIAGIAQKKGWTGIQRNDILSEFVQVIKKNRLIGFGVGVDAACWRKLEPKRRKAFGNAQEFCFQRIVRCVVDRMDEAKEQESVALIFDRDMEFSRPRLGLFEHLLKGDRRVGARIASIAFADSKRFVQLQAADLLAWETRKELINRAGKSESTPRYNDLMQSLPYIDPDYTGEFWDEGYTHKAFAAVEAEIKQAGIRY